jgi:hypothetical protein
VREDGRIVGGEGWKENVYNREEWKKEAPENGKEMSHFAHAKGMNKYHTTECNREFVLEIRTKA